MSKKIKLSKEYVLPYSLEEALNRLRVNVGFFGNDVRKIMIVSTEEDEGKSFVSYNVWRQMAMAGEKVILIDLDMRKSVFAKTHELSIEELGDIKGTSQYLAGECDLDDVILKTDFECGDIIVNMDNVVNPSLLLGDTRFAEMLDRLAKEYRYVFIDVPPLGVVSDAELIGSKCDGAILVIRAGETSKRNIRTSMMQLERAKCPLLGTVLNRVDTSTRYYYNRYYTRQDYIK